MPSAVNSTSLVSIFDIYSLKRSASLITVCILAEGVNVTEDVLFNKRPEQLSVEQFIDLTNRVEQALKEIREKSNETNE